MPALKEEILEDIYSEVEKVVGKRSVALFKRKISDKGLKDISAILFELAGKCKICSVLRELIRF
jgi:hypothetical protein